MTELWLKFKDENGASKRILVEGAKFTIGRTPDNDLSIPLINLSRRHAQIDRFGDIFILSDSGSSNGTTLDGANLSDPLEIKNGSLINLGDGSELEAEIISDEPMVALAAIGAVVFVSMRGGDPQTSKKEGDYVYTSQQTENDDEDLDLPEKKETSTKSATPAPIIAGNSALTPANSAESADVPIQKVSGETDAIERASVSFLRGIAANDTRSFLTGKQIAVVKAKVDQFKSSSALAANLKNAKQNSAQIEELAKSKNLRPQFITAAALAELGNKPGDVAKTAAGMIEILSNLRASLGNELADDNLLIIAAYDQGAEGKNLAMRDTVAGLANKFPNVSSRTVRTIWFLRENGKLSDAQFEFALKFLAVGIITQNPKDFNVQSDAVVFN
jgi:hypothetical protein